MKKNNNNTTCLRCFNDFHRDSLLPPPQLRGQRSHRAAAFQLALIHCLIIADMSRVDLCRQRGFFPLKKGLDNHWAITPTPTITYNSLHLKDNPTLWALNSNTADYTPPPKLPGCRRTKTTPTWKVWASCKSSSWSTLYKRRVLPKKKKQNTKMFSLYLVRNDIPQKEGRAKAVKSTQQTVWT